MDDDPVLEHLRAASANARAELEAARQALAAHNACAIDLRRRVQKLAGTVASLNTLLAKHGDDSVPAHRSRIRTPPGSIDHAEVARVANEARAAGKHQAQAVAAETGCTVVQAEGRIQTARSKGLIPPRKPNPVTGNVSIQCDDCDAEFALTDLILLAFHCTDAHNRNPTPRERTPRPRMETAS